MQNQTQQKQYKDSDIYIKFENTTNNVTDNNGPKKVDNSYVEHTVSVHTLFFFAKNMPISAQFHFTIYSGKT